MMKSKHSSKKDIKSSKDASFSSPANSSGKVKESRSRSPDSSEECDFVFPMLKTVDKTRNLHCYSAVLSRSKDEPVTMEELDRLQPELEILLSTVSVRLRTLQAEVAALNSAEESKSEKRGSIVLGSKKRKTNEVRVSKSMKDLSKVRDREGSTKVDGASSENDTDTTGDVVFDPAIPETTTSKIVIPKNDTPNKFWASIEPYCSDITQENLRDLEELISGCDNDLGGVKIPPLGKHYTARWADEDLAEEKEASNLERSKRKSTDSSPETRQLLKRANVICGRDKTPGPLVQRLVSALMEDNNMTSPLQESFLNNKMEDSDGGYIGKLPLYHTTSCFERRIRRELELVGFMDSTPDETDEILNEIKKCDEELKLVASQNKDHLKQLLALAKQEMIRQEIKSKIKAIDAEVLEIFRKTTAAKLKKKQLQKKEKEQAWKALKDREALIKSLENV